MSIDANDGLAKFMRRGVGQESEDVALVEAGLCIGSSAAIAIKIFRWHLATSGIFWK